MQRFLGTLATKDDLAATSAAVAAIKDGLQATNTAVEAIKVNLQATNACFGATGANCEALKADLQATNRQLARMHRKTGDLEEAVANTAVRIAQRMRAGQVEHSKDGHVAGR
jgi:chromosome segregation ATPase